MNRMCPLFIVMPLIGEIVKTASMLSAIAELEIDIMGSVLEDMEDQKLLLEQLRSSATNRIGVTGEALKEFLETLFNTIDYTHKGYLNKSDIREFFRALHLHYSNDKFNRLFFVIDHNKDGEISFTELYRLLCPTAVEEEERKVCNHSSFFTSFAIIANFSLDSNRGDFENERSCENKTKRKFCKIENFNYS